MQISELYREESIWNKKGVMMLLLLGVALWVLTPRFYEPTGESWRSWAAARILTETGGFPVFSMGPLYVFFLQFFRLFEYPFSMMSEFLIMHFLTYIAIFLMLRCVLSDVWSFILTCAWIPALTIVEPGGMIPAIGLLALYIKEGWKQKNVEELMPLTLFVATLCHNAFLPFLAGHMIGVIFKRIKEKTLVLKLPWMPFKSCGVKFILKSLLFCLLLCTLLMPSKRIDHNHMLIDPKYAPVSIEKGMTTAFFMIGNWKYIYRTMPEDSWSKQDWYLSNDEAFGGAQSVLEAFIKAPQTAINNIFENVGAIAHVPALFVVGNVSNPLVVLAVVLFSIGCMEVFITYGYLGRWPHLFAVTLGTIGVIGALLLTWFSQRYLLALLPIGLLMVTHIGRGLCRLIKTCTLKEQSSCSRPWLMVVVVVCIVLGVVFNEWVIASLFHKTLSVTSRLQIWSLDMFLIMSGCLFFIFKKYSISLLSQEDIGESYLMTHLIIGVSVVTVFLTVFPYPKGIKHQMIAVFNQKGMLRDMKYQSMVSARQALLKHTKNTDRILALEANWIKAFMPVELGSVSHIHSLPPFKDAQEEVDNFFSKINVVWVNPLWADYNKEVSTTNLRYRLHVEPFLKKALQNGWEVTEIDGFWKIYRRSNS